MKISLTFLLLVIAVIGFAWHKPAREDVIWPCRMDDSNMTPPCRLKVRGFKGVSPLHRTNDIRPLLT